MADDGNRPTGRVADGIGDSPAGQRGGSVSEALTAVRRNHRTLWDGAVLTCSPIAPFQKVPWVPTGPAWKMPEQRVQRAGTSTERCEAGG